MSEYKVKASYPPRIEYPCYVIQVNPKEWHCNANVFLRTTIKDGKSVVDIDLHEIGSVKTHHIHVDEKGCRVSEQKVVEE
mgnify:FL=1|jgi:hypothetical protein|tara:strand:- start:1411 stop:1650 length:240 start_codon:yes stop_codon:yes gene_type:complete